MVLLIIIPIKWLFHWEYTLFSDKPIFDPDVLPSSDIIIGSKLLLVHILDHISYIMDFILVNI